MTPPRSGGGWRAIAYTLGLARRVGPLRLWRAMNSRNACKTCALGMGGQAGAMRNEAGHWPEVCKKSLQAMVADMQGGIRPHFFKQYSIDQLRALTSRELESLGRVVTPLHAGPDSTHFAPMDWETAPQRTADALRACPPEQAFFYVSGRSSNEAAFLLQLFARLYGTNHVSNCSYYCHQASGVGLTETIGSGTATVALEDVEQCDLFFLIGGNPASNHPRLMRSLMNIRRAGGQVIVINPLREAGLVNFSVPSDMRSLLLGSPIASLYLQPHIGGDIALLTGIARRVLERGQADLEFAATCTEGWNEFRASLESARWDEIERSAGVPRRDIERAADLYAASKRTIFGWTMGITHHAHGVDNVRAIVNLALLRGMIGRPGAGLLPIRGHSNVQGIGSVGVTPRLKQAVFERLETHFGVKLPSTPGYDTLACLEAADRGEMRVGICLGGNLYAASPDLTFARRALGRLDTLIYLTTTLNLGHVHARGRETLVLPVLARDEEPQKTTQESMFNYVRLSDGGPARHAGPRSEVAVFAELGRRVLGSGGPLDWHALAQHQTLREAIARIVPGYEALAQIEQSRREFHIAGRVLHRPQFATPSGKAHYSRVESPRFECGGAPRHHLRLMTIRSEGQFNTVVYEEEDLYRGQERRDVILMNAGDIAAFGLTTDALVTVRGEAGVMRDIRVRPFDIRAGNAAMYYPEANAIVPNRSDPASRTPAFKSVDVTLELQASPMHSRSGDGAPITLHGERISAPAAPPRKLNAC